MTSRFDTKLRGSAGEHYVCSMLARYGWAASLTRDGLERTDVLAVHSVERDMIEGQVKTIRTGKWMLGRKGTLSDPLRPRVVRTRETGCFARTTRVLRRSP
jgi:hypothetical protein